LNPLPTEQQAALWSDALCAAAVLAVLGHSVGGALVRARPGPVRDFWLEECRRLQPEAAPWRKLPLHCSTDRLLGGLNLTATLRRGSPVAETGLLAECHEGIAVLPMAERAPAQLNGALCAVLDRAEVALEREGIAARMPAALALLALDESLEDEEGVDEALADRLGLRLDLSALAMSALDDSDLVAADIAAARARSADMALEAPQLDSLCRASIALGVHSPRALLFAARVTVALAALAGRAVPTEEDLSAALRLVLLPRATQLPAQEQEQAREQDEQEATAEEPDTESPPDQPGDDRATEPDDPPEETDGDGEGGAGQLPEERLLEAACAALPDALLAQLVARAQRARARGAGGKSGALQRHKLRGRPMGSQAGDPRSGARLDLIATLRTAAPWQRLRRGEDDRACIRVEPSDFRVVRFRQRAQSVTVFVVDASGSAALYRLAEAKGAVELLLADCYVRRDEVALIAFRGNEAELLLPPTRSLVRAKRSLSALPGGGGTPLASAIDATAAMLEQLTRRGSTPAYVMLTDGRANVARDGRTGREAASADALQAARLLRSRSAAAGMVIDTSPRPHRSAEALAAALDATYLPLPHADASQLTSVVRGISG
jgi:magnesium chelatase subunit D